MEFHRNASYHAHGEIDGEDLHPETGGFVVPRITGSESGGLQNDNQKRQPHGELGKQIMEGNRECEMQPVDCEG